MAPPRADWRTDYPLWIEAFIVFNLAGLALDIVLAHSENHFRRSTEYIPLVFSIVAVPSLAALLAVRRRLPAVWRDVGYLIGWCGVTIGIAGLVLHLDSRFFYERTIRSLTYAAPFAAPLAFTGLGLLLISNRMVDPSSIDWPRWMLLLSVGGFIGNFVFSLTDHAMNGFYNPLEWIPVVTSAMAVGWLLVPVVMPVRAAYLKACAYVVAIQAAVGLVGFALHAASILRQPAGGIIERLSGGAPLMAPLLFPNLSILALVALWVLARRPAAVDILDSARLHDTSQASGR
jgi:Na+-translocating ferredoxin:NAD+ oxidoreductase RnfA subunit